MQGFTVRGSSCPSDRKRASRLARQEAITTNPIESTFSTIRLQHRRTKGSGSRKASLTMMFKLAQSASRRWRRLNGHQQIVLVLDGRVFADGVLQNAA